jgi:hypothetical protein
MKDKRRQHHELINGVEVPKRVAKEIRKHPDKYAGKWVAFSDPHRLKDAEIIAFDINLRKVHYEATERGFVRGKYRFVHVPRSTP